MLLPHAVHTHNWPKSKYCYHNTTISGSRTIRMFARQCSVAQSSTTNWYRSWTKTRRGAAVRSTTSNRRV